MNILERDNIMFKNIIGYNHIKNELVRIIDCINNVEKYKKLGIKIPKNLLLHGEPGVGKTLFANAFVNALNRNKYIIRKDMPNGKFVEYINKTVKEAIDNQPSVILFDDIDKFSNNDDDHKNSDEFIVVQSLIDDCKNKDVYFVATANDLEDMPDSLLRAGRFDCKILVHNPTINDSISIIKHYLSDKMVDKNIDYEEIAKILNGGSCALLETVINEAGLYAGYKNDSLIRNEDIIKACLRVLYGDTENLDEMSDEKLKVASIHEAGHALVSEILEPQSVNLVTVSNYFGSKGGITSITRNENYWMNIKYRENCIMTLLAGKAAIEIILNRLDTGATNDLERVRRILSSMHNDYLANNFNYVGGRVVSDNAMAIGETWIRQKMEDYYNKTKKILFNNKDKLEKLYKLLMDKKVLLQKDITNVIEEK